MKKTIAALALFASSNAMAMPQMPNPNAPKPVISNVCLSTYTHQDGAVSGGCDETFNNQREKRPLLANGCAAEQVALSFVGESTINSCMPPGMAQL
ncbi:MAG: hypothetical protein EOP06_06650 [Proteobacteria bacterium]|nr:MAG: hypothetical protein EOP06_06650 [Pseudomonadota bacterium]